MASLSHPGVYVEEIPGGVRAIPGVATSVGLFIGWAARGPIDRAVRLGSFADYELHYGGLDQRSLLGYGVRQFFSNGGADAWVIRLSSGADAATATLGDLTVEAASPGQWADACRVRVTPRPAPDDDRFDLEVLDDPTNESVVEMHENLSMSDTDECFVETVINERSRFIKVETTGNSPPGSTSTGSLAGGDDGAMLDPTDAITAGDFNAEVLAQFSVGAVADRIDLFNLVCVPGLSDGPTIQSLQAECARKRAFLIVDCTEGASVDSVITEAGAMIGPQARNSAFYFPWVRGPDPLQQGAVRAFPPSGYVAGICARTDSRRGVWKAPAGSEATLDGAIGFEVPMTDVQIGQLNPRAVNCLRTLPVYGNVVWGARTMIGDNDRGSEWKYVPVRRLALFLEESLFRGTQWVVFEPNDEPLWAQIRLSIGNFLQDLFRQGAFQGRTPDEAYFVKCDRDTTTQADINLGIVNIQVGFAPLKPAEFVVIRIQQKASEVPP